MEVLFTPQANKDLIEIAIYTEQEWGKEQAEKYLDGFIAASVLLKQTPHLGKPLRKRGVTLRTLQQGQHLLIYRIEGQTLLVSRILHVGMDVKRHNLFPKA